MNKLLTDPNGGVNLAGQDVRFEQDAIRDAFKMILSLFGEGMDKSWIVTGCTITATGDPDVSNCSAGIIILNGEPCRVDPHTFNPNTIAGAGGAPSTGPLWEVIETNAASGAVNLFDATAAQLHKVRKARIVTGPLVGSFLPAAPRMDFRARMQALLA
jgi:hypothetical protein